jgi:hypothetical protein
MGPVAAALIGAGIGSLTGVSAQFLAHWLSLRRERRSTRRQRQYDALIEASLALWEPRGFMPRLPKDELAYMKRHGVPERLRLFHESHSRATVLLYVHFGPDHQVISDYGAAYRAIAKTMWPTAGADEMEAVAAEMEKHVALLAARDRFVKQALAHANRT